MRVLIACEFSGIVREAFAKQGHDAISCDFLPTEIEGNHHQGDVLEIINDGFDLMVAHPPCTFLSNSGVQHLHKTPLRWMHMVDGARFFKALLNSGIPRVAVENPIMHKYAKAIIGRGQDQVVQPWMFGHKEQKATCLWLKGLPKLEPVTNLKEETMKLPNGERQRLHWLSNTPDRAKLRSVTFQGLADAMAEQWGGKN